jgi:hypothetical protein
MISNPPPCPRFSAADRLLDMREFLAALQERAIANVSCHPQPWHLKVLSDYRFKPAITGKRTSNAR